MKSEKKFAPVASNWHNQNFAVEIEGDNLYLGVFSEDRESFKRLGAWAEILPASPIKYSWDTQTTFEGSVEGGRTITVYDRKNNKPFTEKEEKRQLVIALASELLAGPLHELFPKNNHVQYADPAQKELDATKLKEVRKSLNMTQADFAEYLGAARRTVQDWELDNRKIPNTVVEVLKAKGQL